MIGFKNSSVSVETPPQHLPADLRAWLSAAEVLALATAAVELVTREPAFRKGQFEQFNAAMMLRLLGYCYATDSFSSEDVAWTAANEELLRLLPGAGVLDAPAIRRFRRAYRPWILQCLIYMLQQAMAEQSGKGFEASEPATVSDVVKWASRKIELAILMDAAAAD